MIKWLMERKMVAVQVKGSRAAAEGTGTLELALKTVQGTAKVLDEVKALDERSEQAD